MMSNPPFFYIVKFHFLGFDENNNLVHHNWHKDYDCLEPLEGRKQAFEAFHDYLNDLKTNLKVQQDSYGNYTIISPYGLPKVPEIKKEDDLDTMFSKIEEGMKFREDLEVLVVLADDEMVNEIGLGDNVFPIHSISSQAVYKQDLLSNLELIELELYKWIGQEIHGLTKVVKHYGVDYAESGEDEEEATCEILPTPFHWTTKEQYLQEIDKKDSFENNGNLSWEEIIPEGESNTLEFKPSFAYNFRAELSNYKPLFNNLKTICGFMNSNGGILLIGVSDTGNILGVKPDLDLYSSKDKLRLKLDEMICSCFSNAETSLIDLAFEQVDRKEILIISVQPSSKPIFLKWYNPLHQKNTKHFFVRRVASTTEIKDVEETINYVFHHWRVWRRWIP